MLNPEIISVANDRIELELAELIQRLNKDIILCMSNLGALGLEDSGVAQKKISDLCSDAIMNSAQLAWQTLFRFISTSGIKYSHDLETELINIIASHLPEGLDNIKECLKAFRMDILLENNLRSTRNHALRKVETEVNLFMQSLKNEERVIDTYAQSNIFHIYSPVGAIQVGNNLMANVSQQIDSENSCIPIPLHLLFHNSV